MTNERLVRYNMLDGYMDRSMLGQYVLYTDSVTLLAQAYGERDFHVKDAVKAWNEVNRQEERADTAESLLAEKDKEIQELKDNGYESFKIAIGWQERAMKAEWKVSMMDDQNPFAWLRIDPPYQTFVRMGKERPVIGREPDEQYVPVYAIPPLSDKREKALIAALEETLHQLGTLINKEGVFSEPYNSALSAYDKGAELLTRLRDR